MTDAISPEQAIEELWRRGRSRWKLFEDQQEVYDALWAFLTNPDTRYGQFWFDVHRQWGKTFLGLTVSDEFARRFDGTRIVYTSATQKGLWQFVQPNIETLLCDCPAELRPTWIYQESSYRYENGSQIHLAGVNNDHENDARGPKADLIVNEEASFVDRLDYLIGSVELPMLTTTGGRILNITTPAESPAHDSFQYRNKCLAEGHYIRRTIDDNRHMSQAAKSKLISEMGGPLATKARRELWCEWLVEEERAVCPEFTDERAKAIVEPVSPPTYETPLVALDVGFEDYSHVLFGYYSFRDARLMVQAECRLKRMRTDELATAVKDMEARLWSKYDKRPARCSDVDLILLHDMSSLHGLHFQPTAKDEKEAMVNELRLWVQSGRIRIDPSCVHLVRQLKSAIWNKARTSFERTSMDGHFDGVDALIYMLRNAPVHLNPYPALDASITLATHTITAEAQRRDTPVEVAMRQIFNRRRPS